MHDASIRRPIGMSRDRTPGAPREANGGAGTAGTGGGGAGTAGTGGGGASPQKSCVAADHSP